MKVERTEPKKEFIPVVITLESQDEVDALQGIFQCTKISDVLEPVFSQKPWKLLKPFATEGQDVYFERIHSFIR